jgi:hypothetical protein
VPQSDKALNGAAAGQSTVSSTAASSSEATSALNVHPIAASSSSSSAPPKAAAAVAAAPVLPSSTSVPSSVAPQQSNANNRNNHQGGRNNQNQSGGGRGGAAHAAQGSAPTVPVAPPKPPTMAETLKLKELEKEQARLKAEAEKVRIANERKAAAAERLQPLLITLRCLLGKEVPQRHHPVEVAAAREAAAALEATGKVDSQMLNLHKQLLQLPLGESLKSLPRPKAPETSGPQSLARLQ